MNLVALLIEQARVRPDRDAIIEDRGRRTLQCTFAQLEDVSARGASLLYAAGLRPGDRVLVMVPMSVDLYALLAALWRVGAVAVFADPRLGEAHRAACCRDASPRAIVVTGRSQVLRLASGAFRRIDTVIGMGTAVVGADLRWRDVPSARRHEPVAPADATAPAVVTYTSGSTGDPKPTVRTHGVLRAQHRALERHLALRPGVVDLTTLPLFVLANVGSGVTTVIASGRLTRPAAVNALPILRQIERHGVSRVTGPPSVIARLFGRAAGRGRCATVTEVVTGGAPIFAHHRAAVRSVLPDARIVSVYGATEAEPIAVHVDDGGPNPDADDAGLPAGAPVPEIAVRILEDRWGEVVRCGGTEDFERLTVPNGQPGEIVVAGPHVATTHGADVGTSIAVGDTIWHRTGDAGLVDGNGTLRLLGRCEGKAVDGNGVQYPLPVERGALDVPGVERAAFIGMNGRRILAVQAKTTARPAIRKALEARLGWAALDRIEVFRALPVDRRHNAKTDYPALRSLLEQRDVRPHASTRGGEIGLVKRRDA